MAIGNIQINGPTSNGGGSGGPVQAAEGIWIQPDGKIVLGEPEDGSGDGLSAFSNFRQIIVNSFGIDIVNNLGVFNPSSGITAGNFSVQDATGLIGGNWNAPSDLGIDLFNQTPPNRFSSGFNSQQINFSNNPTDLFTSLLDRNNINFDDGAGTVGNLQAVGLAFQDSVIEFSQFTAGQAEFFSNVDTNISSWDRNLFRFSDGAGQATDLTLNQLLMDVGFVPFMTLQPSYFTVNNTAGAAPIATADLYGQVFISDVTSSAGTNNNLIGINSSNILAVSARTDDVQLTGDGVTTVFTINHGLGFQPNTVFVSAQSAAGSGAYFVNNYTNVSFDLNYIIAPVAGNFRINYLVKT